MKGKRIFAAVTACVMIGALFAGCAKDEKKQISQSTDTAKMRILWWGAQERHDSTIKVLDMYEEKTGNVEFEPEFMGYSGYYEKIATLAAASNWPDIMQFDMLGITPYIRSGRLLDMTKLVENNTIDLSDVADTVVESGRADGGLYALSLGTNAPALAYNPKILEKAGVSEIPMDWTWSEMEAIFEKIAKNTDAYPIDAINFGQFHYYLRMNGKSLYNTDATGLGYDDDKLFEDFFNMYLDYMDKGYCLPPQELVAATSPEDSGFAKGEVAMQINWSNALSSLEESTGVDLKILPLPKGGSNEAMYTKPTLYFSISADSKNPEKAADFLSYFINDIEANKILNAERGVPVSAKVREALLPSLSSSQKKVFEYIDYLGEHSSNMDPLPPSCGNEIDNLLSEIDEQIRFGQISTKKAAKEFRKQAESIFARAK